MTVKLEFSTDNVAFEGDDLASGIATALRDLADRVEEQSRSYLANNGSRMRISDSNGNGIGFAYFDVDEVDEATAERLVRDLDREQCVALLERVGIQSYDHEADHILRTAVQECLLSLDLSPEDLEGV